MNKYQELIEQKTLEFNEKLSGMTFQEVVNLALTGYLSIQIKQHYNEKLWQEDENHADALIQEEQRAI